jgi:hypothetical protein
VPWPGWRVLAELLFRGRFRYLDSGILDRTHLRFFTRESIFELFSAAGFRVERCEPLNLAVNWKALPFRYLLPHGQEVLAMQYAIVGRPCLSSLQPVA